MNIQFEFNYCVNSPYNIEEGKTFYLINQEFFIEILRNSWYKYWVPRFEF